MTKHSSRQDAKTAASIDRITRDMLAQLELQTQVVLTVLERTPEAQRASLLERLADLRGRLVRLRAEVIGQQRPALVRVERSNSSGGPEGDA